MRFSLRVTLLPPARSRSRRWSPRSAVARSGGLALCAGPSPRASSAGMSRPDPVRYLCSEPTMAYPHGRLLAARDDRVYLLAADGWIRTGRDKPAGAKPLSREEAEDWCEREGWDLSLLDAVPAC